VFTNSETADLREVLGFMPSEEEEPYFIIWLLFF
jgi:hypothetical protein